MLVFGTHPHINHVIVKRNLNDADAKPQARQLQSTFALKSSGFLSELMN